MLIRESLGCIDLNITSRCNCDCRYCTSHGQDVRLETDVLEKLFDKLLDLQTKMVVLSGGEPLMYPELDRIFGLADEYGRFTALFTNGLLADASVADRIKADVNVVRMTLDSTDEKTFDAVKGDGAFRKLLETFSFFHERNIPVNLNMPVGSIDDLDMDDVIGFCVDNKVLSIRFSPVLPADPADKVYTRLLDKILKGVIAHSSVLHFQDFRKVNSYDGFAFAVSRLNCPGGTISLNVNADGGVTKCAFVSEELGNLHENDLDEIWYKAFDTCENRKCQVVPREDLDDMLKLIGSYMDHMEIRKAVSCWYAEVYGKRKMCARSLPFWTLYFNTSGHC